MKSTDLEQLGLNQSEAKVYLALLELSSSTTGPLIDKARVSPSKIYHVLGRLMEKGLVGYIIKSKRKYYSAASPQKVIEYLESEKEKISQREALAKELLPKLSALQVATHEQQTAELFVGFAAMKNAYYTMYDSTHPGDEHLVFLRRGEEEGKPEAIAFFNQLHKKAREKKLRRRLLAQNDPRTLELFAHTSGEYANREGDEVRFSDLNPGGINIINDKILLMHLADEPICVLIKSKQLTEDYRRFFNEVWKNAKP